MRFRFCTAREPMCLRERLDVSECPRAYSGEKTVRKIPYREVASMFGNSSDRLWWARCSSAVLGALLLVGSGCASDLYAPCELDPGSSDPQIRACAAEEEGEARKSCVIKSQLQCDTRVCARYRSSDPFCTARCQSDADCTAGSCREFVYQSGEKYCVESVDLDEN